MHFHLFPNFKDISAIINNATSRGALILTPLYLQTFSGTSRDLEVPPCVQCFPKKVADMTCDSICRKHSDETNRCQASTLIWCVLLPLKLSTKWWGATQNSGAPEHNRHILPTTRYTHILLPQPSMSAWAHLCGVLRSLCVHGFTFVRPILNWVARCVA